MNKYIFPLTWFIWYSFSIGAQSTCNQCNDTPICFSTPAEKAIEKQELLQKLGQYKRHWKRANANLVTTSSRDTISGMGPFNGDPIQGTLRWPLEPGETFNDFSYFYISQYQDLDSVSDGSLLDYNCGDFTYDTGSGYDHDGIDIATYPYQYLKMANNEVNVVAVADGIILNKKGGFGPDDNCNQGTKRQRNRIVLIHFDGTISQYGHMKAGSFTSKNEMEAVVKGEYLGQVGSSGNSSGPHLHFELKDTLCNNMDPNFGPCSAAANFGIPTTSSWWTSQLPYEHPYLNALYTHSSTPVFPDCDESDSTGIPGIKKLKTYFESGDSIVFGSYYRHVRGSYSAVATIYKPDNSIWDTWNDHDSFESGFDRRTELLQKKKLPNDAMEGNWRYQVVFEGEIFQVSFSVSDCDLNKTLTGVEDFHYFNRAGQSIKSSQKFLNSGLTNGVLQAGDFVEGTIGFEVEVGAKFETRLTGCNDLPDNY